MGRLQPFAYAWTGSTLRFQAEMDLAQLRETGEKHEARVGDARAFVEFDLFQRGHAAEDLQASVGNLRQPRVVEAQRQSRDGRRRGKRRCGALAGHC